MSDDPRVKALKEAYAECRRLEREAEAAVDLHKRNGKPVRARYTAHEAQGHRDCAVAIMKLVAAAVKAGAK